jgi:hypothetical protein
VKFTSKYRERPFIYDTGEWYFNGSKWKIRRWKRKMLTKIFRRKLKKGEFDDFEKGSK